MQANFNPTPDDDTVAAVLAALASYLDAPAEAESASRPRSAWAVAGRLAAQGLPAARGFVPGWATADRARRAGRWSSGIVGS